MRSIPLFLALMVLVVLVCGCATSISSIKENPDRFSHKEVSLFGTTDLVFSVPMTEFSIILFSDATGKVIVLTDKQHKQKVNKSIRGKVISFPENAEFELRQSGLSSMARYLAEGVILPENNAELTIRLIYEMAQKGLSDFKKLFFIVEM